MSDDKIIVGETQLEELRGIVESIQAGVRKIRDTGLNKKVLLLLIQQASPTVSGKRSPRKLRLSEIEATLQGLNDLHDYLYGKDPEEEDGV